MWWPIKELNWKYRPPSSGRKAKFYFHCSVRPQAALRLIREMQMPEKSRPEARGRIRAVRKDDVRSQLERRLLWLGLGREPENADERSLLARRLARALRRERRAAGSAGGGYDPVRHLVLARFARLVGRRRVRPESLLAHPREDPTSCARAAGRGPSFSRAPSGSRHSSARPSDSRPADPIFRDTVRATCRTDCADGGAAT